MKAVLGDYFSGLNLGAAQRFGNLCIYPVGRPGEHSLDYAVLEDALVSNSIVIEEVSPEGRVSELRARNLSDSRVFVMDGEELIGAKQNRVVNASFLIPGKAEVLLPVSCVEQGRWEYKSGEPTFRTSQILYPARARQRKHRSTTTSLRLNRSFRSDQGEVWRSVSTMIQSSGTHSQTQAFSDLYAHRQEELERCVKAFGVVEGQVGVAVFIDSRLAVLDAFGRRDTLKRVFPKMLRSYAVDALDRRPDTSFFTDEEEERREKALASAKGTVLDESRCADLLAQLGDFNGTEHPSVGEGTDVRFEAALLAGSALIAQQRLVHMSVFPS